MSVQPNTICRLAGKLVCVRRLLEGGLRAVVHWNGYPQGAMWVVDVRGLEVAQPAPRKTRGTKRKVRFDLGHARKRA